MNAAILTPAAPTHISGYAYAGGDRTVARVDVSTDNGNTWTQAELLDDLGPGPGPRGQPTSTSSPANTPWPCAPGTTPAPNNHSHPKRALDPKGYANTARPRVNLKVPGTLRE